MRVLRLGTYFMPEKTAASHLIDDLNTGMANEKIFCKWIVPVPSRGIDDIQRNVYKKRRQEELFDGYISVYRFSMIKEGTNRLQKTLKYLLSNIAEYLIGVKEKDVDIVFSSSTPPTQGFLSAKVAQKLSKKYGRKVPFIYNLQDIFPDSLVNTGMTHKGSLIWKIGRKIEKYTYQNADKIIVISDGFKKNLLAKGVPANKIEVISNWIDLDSVYPVERKQNSLIDEFRLDPNKYIIVYAGNFGAAQGADIVLKTARELQHIEKIQFVIFGGGVYFEAAKEAAKKLRNVFIHELLPQDRISEVYSLGDVALITCKPGTGNVGMPSKMWSIMACNTPIIAAFDKNSDLADVLKDSGAGICVTPGSSEELKEAIIEAYFHSANPVRCSREYVKEKASKDLCVKKYIDVLKEVKGN